MKFKYKAISASGIEQLGKIEAVSEERAIELLQKHKLVIISIRETKELLNTRVGGEYGLRRISSR